MKINEGKILLVLSGVLTGVILTSFIGKTPASPTRFLTYTEYVNMKNEENTLVNEIRGLKKEMTRVEEKFDKYSTSSQKNKSVNDTLKKELNDLHRFYGSSAAEGPGIVISLEDRNYTFDEFDREQQLNIVHNTDLFRLANELIEAGAEAVSINNHRFVSNSAITCEGPTIMINGEYIVPPFKVAAIGDSELLKYTLSLDESYYKLLADRKLITGTKTYEKLKISGVNIGTDSKNIKPNLK